MKDYAILAIIFIIGLTLVLEIDKLRNQVRELQIQVENLEKRADHTGLKQAMLDVKFKVLSGEWGFEENDKNPEGYDYFLKE